MSWFTLSVWPLVWLLEKSATTLMSVLERLWKPRAVDDAKSEATELQELRAMAQLARTARLIGAREEKIILGAMRLSTSFVRDAMLPAAHISMLNVHQTIGECLISAHLDMHTRFPVTERAADPQAIIGYVNFKDIVSHMRLNPQDPSLRGILRPIPSLTLELPVSAALELMMRERTHIALVRDFAGRVAGLITLEDIVEELVGDIQDEYDMLPVHVGRAGQGWVVGGGVSLERLREQTGIQLPSEPADEAARNVNGWVHRSLGAAAQGGETIDSNGVRLVVRKVRRKQVLEAHLAQQSSGQRS